MTPQIALVSCLGIFALGQKPPPSVEAPAFEIHYAARVVPTERAIKMRIEVKQKTAAFSQARFRIQEKRHLGFSGDGQIDESVDGFVNWLIPKTGGTLRYTFRIDNARDGRSYDARSATEWAIFRGDDLVPPAKTALVPGARVQGTLRFRLPKGWSVMTPFERMKSRRFAVPKRTRVFIRPTGWMIVGRLATSETHIDRTKFSIASPLKRGLDKEDILAFLRWTVPELQKILPKVPPSVLIVGAGDPMWRGGLSAPASLYLHRDRPLISPDGTSPVLHELIHVFTSARASIDGDWIVEGLAELYSLEILRRSGGLAEEDFQRALKRLERKGKKGTKLAVSRSTGATTARAAFVLHLLNEEIKKVTQAKKSLDDVFRLVAVAPTPVTTSAFRDMVENVTGTDFSDFFQAHLPES